MKKRTLAIASAAATLAVCGSIIAGSTYALFTSRDDVNIAVTSGKVSVSAQVVDWDNAKDNPDNKTTFVTSTSLDGADGALVTPVLNGNEVALTGMAPGDKVEFDIRVENKSTIPVKYRTKVECADGEKLMSGLKFELGELNFKGYKSYASAWETLEAGAGNGTVHASIELPEVMDETFMGLAASITYSVEAVQGNANVDGAEEFELLPYAAVTDAQDYFNVLELYSEAQAPAEIILMNDIEANIEWAENTLMGYRFDEDLILDFNGHTLTTNAKLMATANMTLKNGYLFMTTAMGTGGLDVSIDGVLNVENMEYTCVSDNTCIVATRTADVNIKNSKLHGTWYAVSTNASADLNSQNNITIENSELTASYCGILFNVPGNLVLKNTSVSGGEQAVFVRCGDAVIDGCEFTQTMAYGGKYDDKFWASGNEAPYGALVIGNRSKSAYRTAANVTVTNTTLKNHETAYGVYMYGNPEEGLGAALTYDAASDIGRLVQGDNGANTSVNCADFITVRTGEELKNAVAELKEQSKSAVIVLANDIELAQELYIDKHTANLVIDGKGHKIGAAENFGWHIQGQYNLVKFNQTQNNITLKNVTLEHGALEQTAGSYHTLDIYACPDVLLDNVKLVRNFIAVKGGAALVLNGAKVAANNLSVEIGGNAWYGANVDGKNGEASLTLTGNCNFTDADGLVYRMAVSCENGGKLVCAGVAEEGLSGGYSVNADGALEAAYIATANGWEIYNDGGLFVFSNAVNGGYNFNGVTVALMKDVDLNNIAFTPIAKTSALAFAGIFDGNGKTISNLFVANEGDTSAGLFGNVSRGTVKNFKLVNVKITNTSTSSSGATGAVVGNMYPTGNILGVEVSNVDISGHRWIGGILGGGYGVVTDCSVSGGKITATPNLIAGQTDKYDNGDKVGGIVGMMNGDSCNVSGCTASDLIIKAYRDVGGISGIMFQGSVPYFKNNTANNLTVILNKTLVCYEQVNGEWAVVASVNAGEIIGRFTMNSSLMDASNVATGCTVVTD